MSLSCPSGSIEMINNFELISNFYESIEPENNEDSFLFGQIMVRKKDGSEFARSNNRIIKDLVFRSPEDFYKKQKEIVAICDRLHARAYVNVNPRSFKKIALEMAGICLDYIRTGGEVAARSAFSTACGRYKAPKSYWVIDIDDPKTEIGVSSLIPGIVLRIPTPSGAHLISKGFDLRPLRELYPEVDIHKNNPTLLYCSEYEEVVVDTGIFFSSMPS